MEDMGHGRYCFDVDDFDPVVGWERLVEIFDRRATLAGEVDRTRRDYRRRVEAQYDRLFGEAKCP